MAVIKLAIVIVILLVMISKKVHLALALLISSVLLLVLNLKGPAVWLEVLKNLVTDSITYTMSLTILFIGILGYVMNKYQMLTRMVVHLEQVVRSTKLTILLAPTLIGLLLVTGGALMSCPIVDSLGDRLNLPNAKRAAINMVFRHGLYFAYPLSTTLILASQLGGFELMEFIKINAPVAIFIYIVGYLIYLRGVPDTKPPKISKKEYFRHLLLFLLYSLPITSSIIIAVVFGVPFHFALPFGIIAAIVIHCIEEKKDESLRVAENPLQVLAKGFNLKMLLIILAIVLFKNVIGVLPEIPEFISGFVKSGVPLELVIIFTCVLIAFPTGNFQPALAIVYPLMLPIVQSTNEILLLSYILYATGFTCYFTSPLHMCQVLTVEHFKTSVPDLYRNYKWFLPLFLAFVVLWYFVLRFFLLPV